MKAESEVPSRLKRPVVDRAWAGRSPSTWKMAPNDVDDDDDKPLTEILRGAAGDVNPSGGAGPLAVIGNDGGAGAGTYSRGTKRRVGKSGYRGVALHNKSGRYRARITSTAGDGRQRALGYFETKEEAALAWDVAAREIGFAPELLNFPDKEEEAKAEARINGIEELKDLHGGATLATLALGSTEDSTANALAIPGAPVKEEARALIDHKDVTWSHKVSTANKVSTGDSNQTSQDVDLQVKEPKMKGVRSKGQNIYEARIKMRGEDKRTCLGRFKTLAEAADAYDAKAREAGYCVNVCKNFGDHVDSKTLDGIGSPTGTKGIRAISSEQAQNMDRGVIPDDLQEIFDREEAIDPRSAKQKRVAENGGDVFGAFLLDKPGIYKFLGVFKMEAHCVAALKNTIPEWKLKNQERERNGRGAKARKKQEQEALLKLEAPPAGQATQAEAVTAALPAPTAINGSLHDTTPWQTGVL